MKPPNFFSWEGKENPAAVRIAVYKGLMAECSPSASAGFATVWITSIVDVLLSFFNQSLALGRRPRAQHGGINRNDLLGRRSSRKRNFDRSGSFLRSYVELTGYDGSLAGRFQFETHPFILEDFRELFAWRIFLEKPWKKIMLDMIK